MTMRVLIAAPRKSGGAHLRCLLAQAYGLAVAGSRDAPSGVDFDAIASWLASLPDDAVSGADYRFSPELASAAAGNRVTLIGLLRHPFDLFLSNYEVAQQRAARKKNTPEDLEFWSQFAGLSLDDPKMVEYAQTDFGAEVDWLLGWKQSGAATLRYEELASDPASVLYLLAPSLGDLTAETIDKAVAMCPPESLIVSRPFRGRRMGDLPAGTWRERLPPPLLETLRERYAEAAGLLGYEVW